MAKMKMPDFKKDIPDFQSNAEKELKSVMDKDTIMEAIYGKNEEKLNKLKDTMNSSEKMEEANETVDKLKKKFGSYYNKAMAFIGNEENMEKISEFASNFDIGETISKGAGKVGINVSGEKINSFIDKKNELESAITSKTFEKIKTFMRNEGHPIDDINLESISKKLSSDEDPVNVAKDIAKPFTSLVKEKYGEISLSESIKNIDMSNIVDTAKTKVSDISSKISNIDIDSVKETASKTISNITSEGKSLIGMNEEEIKTKASEIKNKVETDVTDYFNQKANNIDIKPEIPDSIQEIINKFNLNGGENTV